jgi:hypothetical protein
MSQAHSVPIPCRSPADEINPGSRHGNKAISSLIILIRLRYLLIWASIRTSRVRMFLGGCAAVLLIWLVFAAFTSGTLLANLASRPESFVRQLGSALTFLFVGIILVNAFLGRGVVSSFSDRSLERYPISRVVRFTARWIAGISDPLWIIVGAQLIGLAVGLHSSGSSPLWIAIPACGLLLAVTYCYSSLVLAFLTAVAQVRLAKVIGALTICLALIFLYILGAGGVYGQTIRVTRPAIPDLVFMLLPGHLCAAALTARTLGVVIWSSVLLLAWLGVAILSLCVVPTAAMQSRISGSHMFAYANRLSYALSPRLGAIVVKAILYYSRCNMVRYWTLTTGPAMGILAPFLLLAHRLSEPQRTTLFLVALFVTSSTSTAPVATNHFGWDGSGLARYGVLPLSLKSLLRAHSYASLLIGSMGAIPVFAVLSLVLRIHFSASLLCTSVCGVLAGIFLLNACGLWLSVHVPKRMDFDTTIGNGMPLASSMTVFAGIQLPIILLFHSGGLKANIYPRFAWLIIAMAVLSTIAYFVSLKQVCPQDEDEMRKSELIETLAIDTSL